MTLLSAEYIRYSTVHESLHFHINYHVISLGFGVLFGCSRVCMMSQVSVYVGLLSYLTMEKCNTIGEIPVQGHWLTANNKKYFFLKTPQGLCTSSHWFQYIISKCFAGTKDTALYGWCNPFYSLYGYFTGVSVLEFHKTHGIPVMHILQTRYSHEMSTLPQLSSI